MGEVIPWLREAHAGKVKIVAMPFPQPWHMHSNTMNAAVLAAEDVAGQEKAVELMQVLYSKRERFSDEATLDKSVRDVWVIAAELAEGVGVDKEAFLGRFEFLKEGGSLVMKRLKHYIKAGRKQGVHVSPTVYVNGVEDGSIGSSWGLDEWKARMEELVGKEDAPSYAGEGAAKGGAGDGAGAGQ